MHNFSGWMTARICCSERFCYVMQSSVKAAFVRRLNKPIIETQMLAQIQGSTFLLVRTEGTIILAGYKWKVTGTTLSMLLLSSSTFDTSKYAHTTYTTYPLRFESFHLPASKSSHPTPPILPLVIDAARRTTARLLLWSVESFLS